MGSGQWANAYVKAKVLVAQMTLVEKVCMFLVDLDNSRSTLQPEPDGNPKIVLETQDLSLGSVFARYAFKILLLGFG